MKSSHIEKIQKKWGNTREKFSHILSRQRDSSNLQQDTLPWDAVSVTA